MVYTFSTSLISECSSHTLCGFKSRKSCYFRCWDTLFHSYGTKRNHGEP